MTIFRCDGCGKTEESPSGLKPAYWLSHTWRFRADGSLAPLVLGQYVEVDPSKTRVAHACSFLCVGPARDRVLRDVAATVGAR